MASLLIPPQLQKCWHTYPPTHSLERLRTNRDIVTSEVSLVLFKWDYRGSHLGKNHTLEAFNIYKNSAFLVWMSYRCQFAIFHLQIGINHLILRDTSSIDHLRYTKIVDLAFGFATCSVVD
jgi:hypothetical protein